MSELDMRLEHDCPALPWKKDTELWVLSFPGSLHTSVNERVCTSRALRSLPALTFYEYIIIYISTSYYNGPSQWCKLLYLELIYILGLRTNHILYFYSEKI